MSAKKPKREPRNEKLKIELPFDEAVRAALETTPNKKPKRKPRPR